MHQHKAISSITAGTNGAPRICWKACLWVSGDASTSRELFHLAIARLKSEPMPMPKATLQSWSADTARLAVAFLNTIDGRTVI